MLSAFSFWITLYPKAATSFAIYVFPSKVTVPSAVKPLGLKTNNPPSVFTCEATASNTPLITPSVSAKICANCVLLSLYTSPMEEPGKISWNWLSNNNFQFFLSNASGYFLSHNRLPKIPKSSAFIRANSPLRLFIFTCGTLDNVPR